MKLSEAIREWKRNITTNMAVEYVLTLRADINAFSDAAQALERENAKLRELARDLRFCARQSICLKCEHGRICDLRLDERCAELRIEV